MLEGKKEKEEKEDERGERIQRKKMKGKKIEEECNQVDVPALKTLHQFLDEENERISVRTKVRKK